MYIFEIMKIIMINLLCNNILSTGTLKKIVTIENGISSPLKNF